MGFFDLGIFEVWLLRLFTWFNSWSPVFILAPDERAFGNCSIEIYFGFLYARRMRKKILILRPFSLFGKPHICNREIFKLTSPDSLRFGARFFQFLGNAVLTLFFGHLPITAYYLAINGNRLVHHLQATARYRLSGRQGAKPVFCYQQRWHLYYGSHIGKDFLWNPNRSDRFTWENSRSVNWGQEFDSYLPVTFSAAKASKAAGILREMGILEQDWFVCLHVRDGGFWGDTKSERNSDVKNCLPAIRDIIAMGGKVVRIGDSNMTRLPEIPGLIEYPFTPFKSELMDLYLIQNCRLYVGTTSGPMDVAHLFQKPNVLLNIMGWIGVGQRSNGLFIPKHMFSKKLNRFLSVQEALGENPNKSSNELSNAGSDFSFRENSPDEIQAVIREALRPRQSAEAIPTEPFSLLKAEFYKRHSAYIRRWVDEYQTGAADTHSKALWKRDLENSLVGERYQYAVYEASQRGMIGKEFLERNWSRNSLN